MRGRPGACSPLYGRSALCRMAHVPLGSPPRRGPPPAGGQPCPEPGPPASQHRAPRQGGRAGSRAPMRLHDRRDEIRHVLMPGLDPRALVDEQDPRAGSRGQKEHDIDLLIDISRGTATLSLPGPGQSPPRPPPLTPPRWLPDHSRILENIIAVQGEEAGAIRQWHYVRRKCRQHDSA